MDPNYRTVHYVMGWVYKRQGELAKALESFERVVGLDDAPVFRAALAQAHALNGNRSRALSILQELEAQSEQRYFSSCSRAVVYIGLDERDQAFYWLEQAFAERSEMMPWLKIGCEFDGIRADPRFPELLRRVGLDRDYRNDGEL
jgi:tetratricopeptide (TPR) repeat protein